MIQVNDLVDYDASFLKETSKGHVVYAITDTTASITHIHGDVELSSLTKRDLEEAKEPELVWEHEEYKGFTAKAWYLKDSLHCLVEFERDGEAYKKVFPLGYKIYNIHAHFMDIVNEWVSKESVERALSPLP